MIGSFLLQKTMQNPKNVIITLNMRSHSDFSPGTQHAAPLAGPEVRPGMQRAAPLMRPWPNQRSGQGHYAVSIGRTGGPLHLVVVMRKDMSV